MSPFAAIPAASWCAHGSDSLTIGAEQRVGCILLWQPLDLVDFFLNFQALQIVELGLMALESAVNIVLPLAVRLIFTLQRRTQGR